MRDRVLLWWGENQRSFPWRDTRDPWLVLLAEVLLHRTRADQVVPVYLNAASRFPDPRSMMAAAEEELYDVMRSIGLRWRVPLIREMACRIVLDHGGMVPREREALKALPGVSDYIAGAVRCFAFGFPEPLLDTNTVRVTGRFHGLPITDGSRRSRVFRELMEEYVNCVNPRAAVLALLDLAAGICRPRRPVCERCPLMKICQTGRAYGAEKGNSDISGV